MDSPSFSINFVVESSRTKSKSFCSSCAMITFSKLPKLHVHPSFCSPLPLRVHLTDDRILRRSYNHARGGSFGGSPETGAALYVFAVTSSWEQHALTWRIDEGEWRKKRRKRHNALRQPENSRSRHACAARAAPRQINEGTAAPRFLVFSSLLCAREICCESVGTLTREDQPRLRVLYRHASRSSPAA